MSDAAPWAALVGDLLEYFDWERAMDQEPEFAVFHQGTFPADEARRLGTLLLADPDHALQVVARTVAWCVMEPGFAENERAPVLAAVVAAGEGGLATSETVSGVVAVARAGFRYLAARDVEAFVAMMALFDELRTGSYASPQLRAGDNARWLSQVVRPQHGDKSALLPALRELVTDALSGPGRRLRVALFDSAEFAQVWSADAAFEPVDCLIRIPEPVLARRVMHVHPEVISAFASPLAVEYLVERSLLFSVLEDTYGDMVRRIDYTVGTRTWSHAVE
ncbi:MAG: hypothetical protein R3B40_30120 [Polyangiales bacterium]|nr:hypothetical protein [Myxococcales bacterium]MCB9662407.1 hypothetical protein [Sandaracinaceae bacterium]